MVIWRFCTNNDPTPFRPPDIVNYWGDTVTVGSDGSTMGLKWRGALEFLGGVWLRDRIPILLFVATLLVMSYPLVFHLHDHISMSNSDTLQFMWQSWWTVESLVNGKDVYYTPLLFHPNGADLRIFHPNWSTLLVRAPLYLLFGDPFAHNVTAMAGLVFKAYGMYLVGMFLFKKRIPAWVCGAFYSVCSPSLNYALASPNAGATEWLPWFMLAFIIGYARIREGKYDRHTWGLMMLAGLFFNLSLYTHTKIGIFAILLGGGFLALYMLAHGLWRRRAFWLGTVIFAMTVIILAAPLLSVLVDASALGEALDKPVVNDEKAGGVDLLSFVKAEHFRPLNYMQSIALLNGDTVQRSIFPWGLANVGLVSVIFALKGAVYAFKVDRTVIIWVILALVLWLLSLGVDVHLKRKSIDLPLTLYGLLQENFLLKVIRWPFLVEFIFLFPYAVLVGFGLHYRLNTLTLHSGHKVMLVLSVGSLLYATSLFPVPLRTVEKPPHVSALESLSRGALIDVPFGNAASRYYMLLQRYHRRPIARRLCRSES